MSDQSFEKPLHEYLVAQTRRQLLASAGLSAGSIALAGLLGQTNQATAADGKNYGSSVHPSMPGLPHFPAKAKRII